MNKKSLPYRTCVGLVLFNPEGKVFIGERIDTPGAWQMPQGGVDKGESVEEAALRELEEEVGTDKAEILHICTEKTSYDLPDHLVRRLWGGRYRGQEQTWVALRFTGCDSDIRLYAHHTPEFRDWRWATLTEAAQSAVPFKRTTYLAIIDYFERLALQLNGDKGSAEETA